MNFKFVLINLDHIRVLKIIQVDKRGMCSSEFKSCKELSMTVHIWKKSSV